MSARGGWTGEAGTPLCSVGEFGLIARLRELIARRTVESGLSAEGIAIGIGDDAASLFPTPGHEILITCDIQVAGRHFIPAWTTPRAVGARCATISVSDIGAMGGLARTAIVSLGLGPEVSVEDVEELYEGILDRLLPLQCLLIGGNVTSLEGGLLVDMTITGEVERGHAVRRSTGGVGDILWVTGSPGSAAAGLALLQAGFAMGTAPEIDRLIRAYLEPSGRAQEGRALGKSGAVTSMIDVSDGLIGDIGHMVEGRDVGVLLREEAIPVGEDLVAAAGRLGQAPSSFIASASDDYELLFTTPASRAEAAARALRDVSGASLWPIGELIGGGGGKVVIEDRKGRRRPPTGGGWDHFHPAG